MISAAYSASLFVALPRNRDRLPTYWTGSSLSVRMHTLRLALSCHKKGPACLRAGIVINNGTGAGRPRVLPRCAVKLLYAHSLGRDESKFARG